MQTVQYVATQLLSCARCNGDVIICVDDSLTADSMPFLEATVASVQESWNSCGQNQYTYGFTYDENDLADPLTPLVTSDINGVFCKGCLTDYIAAIGTPSLEYILELLAPYFDGVCLVTDEATFAAAIANADCKEVIVTDSFTLTAGHTVPASKNFRFLRGSVITTNGHTINFNGTLQAEPFQCFVASTPGEVVFGDNTVTQVYPQWFGALGDDANDDTDAIQAAIDSIETSGGWVFFTPGDYRFTGIDLPRRVSLQGSGAKSSVLRYTPVTGDGITLTTAGPLSNTHNGIFDLKLEAINVSTGTGIQGPTAATVADFYLDRYEIEDFLIAVDLPYGLHVHIGFGRLLGQGQGVAGGVGVKLGDFGGAGTLINISEINNCYANGFEESFHISCSVCNADQITSEAADSAIVLERGRLFVSGSWIQATTWLFEIPNAGNNIVSMQNYHLNGASAEQDDVTGMSNLASTQDLAVYFGSDVKGPANYRLRFATTQARGLRFGTNPGDLCYLYSASGSVRAESEVDIPFCANLETGGPPGGYGTLIRLENSKVNLGGIGRDINSQPTLMISTGNAAALTWNDDRDVAAGEGTINTTATNGFLWIPQCAGVPTGVPAGTGHIANFTPLVVDSSNNKLYMYSGGAWVLVGP